MREEQSTISASYIMRPESIEAFLAAQRENGASKDALRQRKGFTTYLFRWLPEDKELTRERLDLWREDMERKGYTQQTILNYVKGINLYLDYMGWSEIRFNRGKAKNIRNITFGYLTPIEPTDKRHRKDVVWRCKCKCGNIVEMPATRLLTGNTLSCGCMKAENILSASKHIAGTHLFQSLKEDAPRSDNLSGYVGVSPKRDKWFAHITYRGTRYHLGTYSNIEDAIKARARAKELVMEDAQKLLEYYEELHKNDYKPDRSALPKVENEPLIGKGERVIRSTVARSNNTSGYPGVAKAKKKWRASISYQKERYVLGYFQNKEDAIAARMNAEKRLNEDPQAFLMEQGQIKELCV